MARKAASKPSTAALDPDTVLLAIERALPNATKQQRATLFGGVFMGSGVLGRQVSPTKRKARLEAIQTAAALLADELLHPPATLWHFMAEGDETKGMDKIAVPDRLRIQHGMKCIELAARKAILATRVERGGQYGGDALQFALKLVLAWRDAFGVLPSSVRKGDFAKFLEVAFKEVRLRLPSDPFRLTKEALHIADPVH